MEGDKLPGQGHAWTSVKDTPGVKIQFFHSLAGRAWAGSSCFPALVLSVKWGEIAISWDCREN